MKSQTLNEIEIQPKLVHKQGIDSSHLLIRESKKLKPFLKTGSMEVDSRLLKNHRKPNCWMMKGFPKQP